MIAIVDVKGTPDLYVIEDHAVTPVPLPLSSERGTHETVRNWLSCESPQENQDVACSLGSGTLNPIPGTRRVWPSRNPFASEKGYK